jgi:hypothetical protein
MASISTNHTFSTTDSDTPPTTHADLPRSLHALRLPDLRCRDARAHSEQIAQRARFLPREQRALITAIYEQGQSYKQLAAISGQPVRCLRRGVQRILQRLASPEFAFVALHMDAWPLTMRRVAQSCVLAGQPVRSASESLRLSLHTVRKYRALVRHMATGGHSHPARTPGSRTR